MIWRMGLRPSILLQEWVWILTSLPQTLNQSMVYLNVPTKLFSLEGKFQKIAIYTKH